MAALLKDKRTPITTPPYQVPSVDVTSDPPIFSLVTTFKDTVHAARWIRSKLGSFDGYLLKKDARRFLKNPPVPHLVKAL